MMITPLIALACQGLTGAAHSSCVRAFEAAGIQSGVSQAIDAVTKKYERIYVEKIEDEVGPNAILILSTAYAVSVKKEVTLRTNQFPLIERVSLVLGSKSAGIGLGWTLP